MDMRLNFYILHLAFSPEFQTLPLQHSPMKNIRLSVNLNCQMHCCNFNCCNFSYLESSIPLQKYFSKLESHKAIRDSGFFLYQFNNICTICWTILFSVIYFLISIFQWFCCRFFAQLKVAFIFISINLKIKNTLKMYDTRIMYDHWGKLLFST